MGPSEQLGALETLLGLGITISDWSGRQRHGEGKQLEELLLIHEDVHRPPALPALGSQHYARGGTLCHPIRRRIISLASPINLLR